MRFVHPLRLGLAISVILVGLSTLAAIPANAATPGRMSGDAIKELVLGATVHMHAPSGSIVPVVYGEDGTLTGQTSGFIAYYLGAAKDRGRWWIKGRKLCQKWNVWFKRKQKCITIRRQGQKFHWRDDEGKTGVATIASRPNRVVATRSRPVKSFKKPYSLGAPEAPIASLPKVRQPVKSGRNIPKRARTTRTVARKAAAYRTPPPLPARPASRQALVKTSSWTMGRRRPLTRPASARQVDPWQRRTFQVR